MKELTPFYVLLYPSIESMLRFTKFISLAWVSLILVSCNQQQESSNVPDDSSTSILEAKIDSLNTEIIQLREITYPKLSVLMNRVQLYHSRMWEPGVRQQWELLAYQFKKTNETLTEISLLYGDSIYGNSNLKNEITNLGETLDSIDNAIKLHNKDEFVKSYQSLTQKCNSCHQKGALDFYEIITPKTPAYNSEIE
jgi:hypothetical protein